MKLRISFLASVFSAVVLHAAVQDCVTCAPIRSGNDPSGAYDVCFEDAPNKSFTQQQVDWMADRSSIDSDAV